MIRSKLALAAVIVMGALFWGGLNMQPAFAAAGEASKDTACSAIGDITPGGSGDCSSSSGSELNGLVELALNLLSMVAGVIAVIMLIVAGLSYITSDGDSTKISHAKSTLIYAIIGIVVVVFAQTIVQFAVKKTNDSQQTTVITAPTES